FDEGRRRRNRSDGKVTSLNRRLYTFGKLDVVDVDGVADFQPVEVGLDKVGNIVSGAVNLDLVRHDVDHAAELEAGRIFLAAKAHGNRQADACAGFQTQKIDMDRPLGYRVDLDRAGNDSRLLAADLEHHQRLKHDARVIELAEIVQIELEGLRLAFAAIDDAGDPSLLANAIGGTLATSVPRFGGKVDHLTHGGKSLKWAKPAGCLEPESRAF